MSKKEEEVTFTRTRTNGGKARKTMKGYTGSGWVAWLDFGLRLFDYIRWMQYDFNDENAMEALHDDVQLLLKGYDLDKYQAVTNSPENANLPYSQRVQLGLAFLTELQCPLGTREILLDKLRQLRKRASQTVSAYAAEFSQWRRKIAILQSLEQQPIALSDQVQIFKTAMPNEFQIEFRKKYGLHNFDSIEDVEAAFIAIENDFDFIKRLNEPKKPATKPPYDSKRRAQDQKERPGQRESKPARAPSPSSRCTYCTAHNYKADNHTSTECGRRDNPKNAPNQASSTDQSRQGLKKARNGPKKDVAALMTEVRNLQRQIKTMSQSAVIPSGDSSEEDTYAMALDDDHHSLDKHGPRITMEVQVVVLMNEKSQVVTGLLDSGSTTSSIQASLVPHYHVQPTKYSKIDGSIGTTLGTVGIPLRLPDFASGRTVSQVCKVVARLVFPIILGLDFLACQEMVLNFKDRTITWDGAVKPMSDDTHCMAHDRTIKDADYAMPTFEEMIPAHLGKEEKLQLLQVLNDHADAFTGKLGNFDLEPFEIPIQHGTKPYATRPYPIPTKYLDATKREINRLVEVGVLAPDGKSPWASPTFIIPKKDGTVRLVSDFRQLNRAITRHPYPLPKIPDLLRSLTRPVVKSAIDLIMGFYARVLSRSSQSCTAIVLPFGKYVYLRLPMGIVCAPDEFQYAMNLVVGDLSFVKCYLDDLLVVSSSFAEHLDHLRIVFQRLIKFGIVAHARKSKFCAETIEYLGFVLTKDGVCPQSNKVEAIVKILPPKSRKELRRFIGMVNYYRDLWPKRAHLCAPLTKLTSDKVAFKWTPDAQLAFDAVKNMVAQSTMLAYPDFALPFDIHTDASKYQLGAVISQHGAPLAFWSKKLSPTQQNYAANKLELLAILEVLREFRTILLGRVITIYTDHLNFVHDHFTDTTMLRWRLKIEEFAPMVVHIDGDKNVVADALSRLPTGGADLDSDVWAAGLEFKIDNLFNLDLATISKFQAMDTTLNTACTKEISGHNIRFDTKGRMLVPIDLRQPILMTYHEWLLHPGANILTASLREVFHWPHMDADVARFTKHCDGCKQKISNKKYGKLPLKTKETHPWFEIAVDTIGPFGPLNLRAITIIDTTTRLLEMANVTNASSLEAAQKLDRLWLCRYPRPHQCIFDQGSEFKLEFLELLDSYGVHPIPTTSKNPTANAIVERIHLVIGNKMRTQDFESVAEWDEFCSTVVFATRASFHSTTRISPGAAAFGRNMFFDFAHSTDWLSVHRKNIERMKKDNDNENKNRIDHTYNPGDKVRINMSTTLQSKLLPASVGPFEIVATRPNGIVVIDRGKYLESISIRRLLPAA